MVHSWPHASAAQPLDAEAQAALRAAERKRRATQEKWTRIHRVTEALTEIRRANHLSERMRRAFEGDETE